MSDGRNDAPRGAIYTDSDAAEARRILEDDRGRESRGQPDVRDSSREVEGNLPREPESWHDRIVAAVMDYGVASARVGWRSKGAVRLGVALEAESQAFRRVLRLIQERE